MTTPDPRSYTDKVNSLDERGPEDRPPRRRPTKSSDDETRRLAALNLAVAHHTGTGVTASSVTATATEFEAYLADSLAELGLHPVKVVPPAAPYHVEFPFDVKAVTPVPAWWEAIAARDAERRAAAYSAPPDTPLYIEPDPETSHEAVTGFDGTSLKVGDKVRPNPHPTAATAYAWLDQLKPAEFDLVTTVESLTTMDDPRLGWTVGTTDRRSIVGGPPIRWASTWWADSPCPFVNADTETAVAAHPADGIHPGDTVRVNNHHTATAAFPSLHGTGDHTVINAAATTDGWTFLTLDRAGLDHTVEWYALGPHPFIKVD
ncbi:MAG: hypothetical protein GY925_21090 [Actinomycetia bacterium]|nr:hypothetical protein [Actinomycetes bacterium]